MENLPALIPASTVDHFGGRERLDLIRDQIAKGTSDGEFALFLAVAERTGLDPFARQIYAIMRWNKKANREVMTIQTGIDGYRSVADRSPSYAGSDRPVFEYDDRGKLDAAIVTVWKMNGHERVPFVGVAYWEEYAQDSPMWAKMPKTMLAKCAEAQALRKAFPSQLAGLYTHEEMMQADDDQDPWRPYRDSLIARARALPPEAKAALKANHPDPRTASPEQLAEFERDLQTAEDEQPTEATIVDDGPGGEDASTPALSPPTDPMAHTLNAAKYDPSPIDLTERAGLVARKARERDQRKLAANVARDLEGVDA